jgi:hypothetical protein
MRFDDDLHERLRHFELRDFFVVSYGHVGHFHCSKLLQSVYVRDHNGEECRELATSDSATYAQTDASADAISYSPSLPHAVVYTLDFTFVFANAVSYNPSVSHAVVSTLDFTFVFANAISYGPSLPHAVVHTLVFPEPNGLTMVRRLRCELIRLLWRWLEWQCFVSRFRDVYYIPRKLF